MVHNPIYDGPVYECVKSHFDSLTTQATSGSDIHADNNSDGKHLDLEISLLQKDDSEKSRYLSQQRLTKKGSVSSDKGVILPHDGGCSDCNNIKSMVDENTCAMIHEGKFLLDQFIVIKIKLYLLTDEKNALTVINTVDV